MKEEFWEEALDQISEEHIEEAVNTGAAGVEISKAQSPQVKSQKTIGRSGRYKWIALAAAAALLLVIVGSIIGIFNSLNSVVLRAYAINEVNYPQIPKYPQDSFFLSDDQHFERFSEWNNAKRERRNLSEESREAFNRYVYSTTAVLLQGETEENRLYAPLNVYMALAMTAELTDGNSRQQLLNLLAAENIEALRGQASELWNASYWDDGKNVCVTAASLWLDSGVRFNKSTINMLAETYYAEAYQGNLQSDRMNGMLRQWLNENTGGLLKKSVDGVSFGPEAIMALATTVYFQEKWNSEFISRNNEKGIFHSPLGDMECEFMYQAPSQTYYWGEQFGAINKRLANGSKMWFILPDEGVSVDELLSDEELSTFLITDPDTWEKARTMKIYFYLPKFDVSESSDLRQGLKMLGVTDIFDPEISDFSPLTKQVEDIYVGIVEHAVRVVVDEEGVTAAAYTLEMNYTGAPLQGEEEEIEFRLDRPFLFMVTDNNELPIFIGVVNQP